MDAKVVLTSILGSMAMSGVDVKVDSNSKTLYLDIPKDSHEYRVNEKIKSAQDYANMTKKKFIEMGLINSEWRVLFKERDIFWTKEMGEINFNAKYNSIVRMANQLT